jgi:hypothetical protein
MSIKFFEIELPVLVRETHEETFETFRMTVRITMGPGASAKDAVDALARKLEETCNTIDIGDCT